MNFDFRKFLKTKTVDLTCVMSTVFVFGLAYPNVVIFKGFSIFSLLMFVPMFYLLSIRDWRGSLWASGHCAVLCYSAVGFWIGFHSFVLFGFLLMVYVFFLFGFFVGFKWFYEANKKGVGRIHVVGATLLLWGVLAWLRQCVLGGWYWGLAQTWAFVPEVIQSVAFLGPIGLAMLIIFFNLSVFFLIRDRSWAFLLVIVVVWVGIWMVGTNRLKIESENTLVIKVGFVQPDASPAIWHDSVKMVHHMIQTSGSLFDVDLMIWPESTMIDDLRWHDNLQAVFDQMFSESSWALLTGMTLLEDEGLHNGAVLFDANGVWLDQYNKQQLVPGWERPLLDQSRYHFVAGDELGLLLWPGEKKERHLFGVLMCSEDAFLRLGRQLVQHGAQWIAVLLNNHWARYEWVPYLHLQNGLVLAAAIDRPVLRVAQRGLSVAIDGLGQVEQLFVSGRQVGQVDLSLRNMEGYQQKQTFYVKFGDILVGIMALFVIIGTLFWQKTGFLRLLKCKRQKV